MYDLTWKLWCKLDKYFIIFNQSIETMIYTEDQKIMPFGKFKMLVRPCIVRASE